MSTAPVFAHVAVTHSEVSIESRSIFSVLVPNESDNESAIVGVRLVIPEGLESVRPNTKPGWTININKSGEDEAARVTEINWAGGTKPYSATRVVDNLAIDNIVPVRQSSEVIDGVKVAIVLSSVALILATIAIVTKRR